MGRHCSYLSLWSVYWLFKLITGKEGMGFGDFKLLATLGAWLGWQMLPVIILLSSVVGAVLGIALLSLQGKGRNTSIPFGPYLAAAGWIAMFWGQDILWRVYGLCRPVISKETAVFMSKVIIGLSGGIGSGKTAVSDRFAAKGIDVGDADVIARVVVEPGTEALTKIREHFGDGILDGDGQLRRAGRKRISVTPTRNNGWKRCCIRLLPRKRCDSSAIFVPTACTSLPFS